MKSFIKYFLFLIIFGYSYGQTTILIPGSNETAVNYVNSQGQPKYEMQGGAYNDDIGQHLNSINGNTTGCYRTEYSFSLSLIPSNATITSAKLKYSLSDWLVTNSFAVCKLSQYYGFQALWDAIGSSPLVFPNLSYNGGETSSTQGLIDAINSMRSNGTLYLGAASLAESNSQSYAKLNLTLDVTYTTPPSTVSFTIDNNFTAPDGSHGSIVINGTTYSAPHTFSNITAGTNFTLQAVSPQTDNQGYQRI